MLTEQEYSEFYSICLNKELAGEIRKSMVQILGASPAVEKHFEISRSFLGKLECKLTRSFFQPRVAEAGKNNSIRPSAFVCDEMGNMTDRSNFDAMRSGQKSVLNPLVFRTTTAYATDNSIMLAELDYSRKVLQGIQEDDNMLALIYYAEEEHLWDDIGLYQANPLRIEANYEGIRKNRAKAKVQDELVSEYLTKEMNVFQPANSGEEFIKYDDLVKCRMTEEEVKKFNWKGRNVYIGLDMASTDDNVGVAMVTRTPEGHYYAQAMAFIPSDSIDEKIRKEHVDYRQMIRNGYCIACGDRIIDYSTVEEYILNLEEEYGVKVVGLGYDKHNATHSINYLEGFGMNCVEVRQYSTDLHPPTKELKESILQQKFHYFPNRLYEMNFINAKRMEDNMKNGYLNKKKSGKIDMAAATVNSFWMWLKEIETKPQTPYNKRGIRFI